MQRWSLVLAAGLGLGALACTWPQQGAAAALDEHPTAAFAAAAARHRADIAALPDPTAAGLWVVEDTTGRLVASGVIPRFPATISSDNYAQVVPGAAGRTAQRFGFARTRATWQQRSLPVAYVAVAPTS